MKTLASINKILIKAIEYLLATLLLIAVVFILLQVIFRYVLRSPLDWTEQGSRFMFIWMMMLGTAVVFYRDSAMAFDLLLHAFSPKLRFWVEAFIKALVIFFSVYYGYQAFVLASSVMGRYTSGVRVPLTFMYSSMVVSNIFVVLVMVEKLLLQLLNRNKEGQTK
ncbi:MAG: TRAP transporter small permease [Candidatus Limivicinus sp.]